PARGGGGRGGCSGERTRALAVRGHALVKEGRRDEGLAALHEALRLRPRRPQAWQSLASAFAAAGARAAAASLPTPGRPPRLARRQLVVRVDEAAEHRLSPESSHH